MVIRELKLKGGASVYFMPSGYILVWFNGGHANLHISPVKVHEFLKHMDGGSPASVEDGRVSVAYNNSLAELTITHDRLVVNGIVESIVDINTDELVI